MVCRAAAQRRLSGASPLYHYSAITFSQSGARENQFEVELMVSLREIRAERLLSIRELARRASVSPSTIFLIEAGRTVPRQRVARQIAQVLRIDPMEVDELRRRIEATKVRRSHIADKDVVCP